MKLGMLNQRLLRRNHQKVVFVALAVVLLAGGSAWAYHDQTQKLPRKAAALTKKTDTLKDELAAFYTTKEQVFIKPDMVTVGPKTLKTSRGN